ncbi:hypothetical protein FISHEDRAFT_58407 [Fistulina hepatica ATCC 64428]|nr:hypothetical protein FISHEDRAFT_58407 [Fistulina hepatica ATCC 64428]
MIYPLPTPFPPLPAKRTPLWALSSAASRHEESKRMFDLSVKSGMGTLETLYIPGGKWMTRKHFRFEKQLKTVVLPSPVAVYVAAGCSKLLDVFPTPRLLSCSGEIRDAAGGAGNVPQGRLVLLREYMWHWYRSLPVAALSSPRLQHPFGPLSLSVLYPLSQIPVFLNLVLKPQGASAIYIG